MIPEVTRVKWDQTFRMINSCYPPCDVWEDVVANSEDWETAFEIEALTNPRIRQEVGDISLIPKDRMITGHNSWWVVSAFTYFNENGTRFTDGHYGAYYAANQSITAIKEKAYGLTAEFMRATDEEHFNVTCRMFQGKINAKLHDIRDRKKWSDCYDKLYYGESQRLAASLRDQESNGVVYQSVRDEGGECFAAFWPDVVSLPTQERHIVLHWDGTKVSSFYEIKDKAKDWVVL